MKKTLFILWTLVGLTACGNPSKTDAHPPPPTMQATYVEVVYFHGKQRCITCNAIEKLTKEVIETDFAQALKEGKVIFRTVDISTKEGEKRADKYEVTWSSLFINRWQDGRETRNNLTEFAFAQAKGAPEAFKTGVKQKVDELLK